jgi:DNA-binding IclR family transcriptional regulator
MPARLPRGTDTPGVPKRYRVQVLDRSFRILDTLAAAPAELSAAELAIRLHLHKSTVHRLLVVLERQRFIRRTENGKYGLGTRLIELGCRTMEQLDLETSARPFLQRLVAETGETTHIGVLSGTEMVSIANLPGRWTLGTPSTIGRQTPVYCTAVGKAFIAFLPSAPLEALIARIEFMRRTKRTIMSPAALRAELARIRRRGFALDDEEAEEGLRCIGAPVRNYTGDVVASLSIAGPVFRVTKGRVPSLAAAVMRAGEELSAELGYIKPQERRQKAVRIRYQNLRGGENLTRSGGPIRAGSGARGGGEQGTDGVSGGPGAGAQGEPACPSPAA